MSLSLNLFALKQQLETHTRREWNWAEIARRVGIHPHTLRAMVKGERARVTLETLAALLAFFRQQGLPVTIADLVIESNDPQA